MSEERPKPITIEDVLAVCDEHPGRVNSRNVTFDEEGAPCCLVGHAGARLGWTLETWAKARRTWPRPEGPLIREAQRLADKGRTWGEVARLIREEMSGA